jgi:hypothetical protein
MEVIVKIFFEHQIIIKMFHFQTLSYGAHKASDEYLEKFLVNHDKFMEVIQGINGKLSMDTIKMDINININNLHNHLSEFINILRNIDKFKTVKKCIIDVGLLAIRDEMLVDVNQFMYLLTFD